MLQEVDNRQCDAKSENLFNKIKILSLNVCGLVSKLNNPDFIEFISLYDIICLTETKIDQYDTIDVEGFTILPCVIRQNCKSKSGGICVLVRDCFCKYVKVIDPVYFSSHSDFVMWFTVDEKLLFEKTLFGVIYIPPENSSYSSIDMFNDIENVIVNTNLQVCLLGDFNAHTKNVNEYIDIDSHILNACNISHDDQILINKLHVLEECDVSTVRSSQDVSKIDRYGKRLLELCTSTQIFIVNGRCGSDKNIGHCTCNNSLIDYVIVSPELFRSIVDFTIMPYDPILSDIHNPVCLKLCTNIRSDCAQCPDTCQTCRSDCVQCTEDDTDSIDSNLRSDCVQCPENVKPRWCRDRVPAFTDNLDVNQIDELLETLQTIDSRNTNIVTINNVVEKCNDIIKNAAEHADMFVKVSSDKNVLNSKRNNCKKYFNSECYIKRKAYRKAKKYHYRVRTVDNHNDLVCKSKEYKNVLKKQFNEYQKSFVSKLRGLRTSDPKSYWSLLNRGCDKGKITQQKVAMNVFFDHFKNLNNVENDVDIVLPDDVTEYNTVINESITEKEVLEAIKSLKNQKACGNDMILNEFLKNGTDKLLPVYVKIFNIVFDSGIVPDSWSQGYICPIYKNKGDPANADNYRGITILSCFGKLFTCVLNNRLFNYLECLGLLCEEQAGFRKGYGTVDHIFNLKCLIDMYLFRRTKLYCAFVDYRKAFDSVNRVLLWQKLLHNGIDGKMFILIKNMYKNAKSCVRFQIILFPMLELDKGKICPPCCSQYF